MTARFGFVCLGPLIDRDAPFSVFDHDRHELTLEHAILCTFAFLKTVPVMISLGRYLNRPRLLKHGLDCRLRFKRRVGNIYHCDPSVRLQSLQCFIPQPLSDDLRRSLIFLALSLS